jgi:predicted AAA+ superfamily ATPase
MFQRPHLQLVKTRMIEQRRFIQVIVGPRQVGKTTLVGQLVKELNIASHSVSADGVLASNTFWLNQQWENARQALRAKEATEFLLVIDEIQKIDNWSETVKALWDEDTKNNYNLKVLLLGSSRLILQKGLTESLAGRFETTYMGHWSLQEMSTAFGLMPEQYAWYGGYPGAASLIHDELRWKHYIKDSLIETSILKDVLMLARIEKPTLLKHLFEIGCLYSAQVLSYTKIMGQLHGAGNTTTLSNYLNLLDTAGLLRGIEKYSPSIIRKRSSSPKFQVHNTALISGQSEEQFKEIQNNPAAWGRIVESAIGAHLLNHSLTMDYELNYWREGDAEVDFIISKNKQTIAIEVKSNKASITNGMKQFQKQYNPQKMILIGADGMKWQDFLMMNPNDLFL